MSSHHPDETPMPELDRITFDPDILGGRACIRGMRISVSLVVSLVADGMTAPQIVAEYQDLEEEDVAQALRYAAWAANR
jgi:uncharacterized protein (DUF433 family)